jgi:hypothetical protein
LLTWQKRIHSLAEAGVGLIMTVRTFIVTYRAVLKHRTIKIDAFSKYDAKQKFRRMHPEYEIIKIEEESE